MAEFRLLRPIEMYGVLTLTRRHQHDAGGPTVSKFIVRRNTCRGGCSGLLLKHDSEMLALKPRKTTGRACLKSPRNSIALPPNDILLRIMFVSVLSTASVLLRIHITTSSHIA